MQLKLCQVKAGGIRPWGAVGSLNFSNATIFSFHSGESHEAIELVYCLSVCVPRDLHGATHTGRRVKFYVALLAGNRSRPRSLAKACRRGQDTTAQEKAQAGVKLKTSSLQA
jgi:hypothetical protein